ncbi:unnamed protein product [Amoebophrya sp. A120]|nr:unnamed protein product [Amoebophrya sp. A120]|eukprot:GSA120T00009996001.1
MASTATISSSCAKVRIRNFAGHEEILNVNSEVCTTIGDLVESFYAQDQVLAKFLKVGQLYPPKHRLKWLKWEEEQSEDHETSSKLSEENSNKDNAAADAAAGFLPTDAALDFSAGTAYQFVIVAARDWHAELEKLKLKKPDWALDATGDDDHDDELHDHFETKLEEAVENFFGSMSFSDAQDFIYDRAYLIPPAPPTGDAGEWRWTETEPWRLVVEELARHLPHRQYIPDGGTPARYYRATGSGKDRFRFWRLIQTVLMLPVREWKKHSKDTQFFALPEREEYAHDVACALLLHNTFSGAAWGAAEESAFAIALAAAELSAGTAAKLVAKAFAPTQQELYMYSPSLQQGCRYGTRMPIFHREINNTDSPLRSCLFRAPMRLLLRDLHSRGKLDQLLASLSRLCGLAGLKLEWVSNIVPESMGHYSYEPGRYSHDELEVVRTAVIKEIKREVEYIATCVGGQGAAALEMWSFLFSEIQECFPTSDLIDIELTTMMKELEEHVAAANADIVDVLEDLGIAKHIEETVARSGSALTWEHDFVPHLREKFSKKINSKEEQLHDNFEE